MFSASTGIESDKVVLAWKKSITWEDNGSQRGVRQFVVLGLSEQAELFTLQWTKLSDSEYPGYSRLHISWKEIIAWLHMREIELVFWWSCEVKFWLLLNDNSDNKIHIAGFIAGFMMTPCVRNLAWAQAIWFVIIYTFNFQPKRPNEV